jgi:hypothetical protein
MIEPAPRPPTPEPPPRPGEPPRPEPEPRPPGEPPPPRPGDPIPARPARAGGAKRFGKILLAVPDVAAEVFAQLAPALPRVSDRTLLYLSPAT